ncbi:signal peptidase II [Acetobacteraceae bacterium H6797]|nr:signal peptidase II [Acetobacteraceae bacterium H6797]
MSRLRIGLPAALAILLIDQFSKWWMLEVLQLDEVRHVPLMGIGPFRLDLTMVWNRGVTFGMLSGEGNWNHVALAVLAAAICAFLLRWMVKAENRVVAVTLGAIIGGAIGNVIDRMRFGAVVDFIDTSAFDWHWYVFNVADAAIVCGVVTLILETLLRPAPQAKEPV